VRRTPSEDDRLLLDQLADSGVPVLVAVTKTDAVPAKSVDTAVEALTTALGLDPAQVIATSSKARRGRDELAAAMVALVGTTG
jgi:GTP-binding protein EngB required for normal cell division